MNTQQFTVTLTSADADNKILDIVWNHIVGDINTMFTDFNEMTDYTVKFTSEKVEA